MHVSLNLRERAVSRYLSKFKVGNGHQIHLNIKKFKLLQVDMKNKSNTELESCKVALLRKAQDLDNHWCWSFFMKLNKPQREISAAATSPGSTFSIRSLLSVSTRSSAFSRRSPSCDTFDPSNQGPRIDTAFVSRFSVRRSFNSLGLQARDKVDMLEVSTINIFLTESTRKWS